MRMTTPRRFLAATAVALATLTCSTVPGQAHTVTSSERAVRNLPGYQMLYSDPTTVDNLTPLTFECPAGKVAVSGGADVQGAGAVLVASFPTLVGSSSRWTVVARQVGKPQVTLTVYMLCANSAALPGYQLANLPSADVANRASREAACPAGKVVVSGGAETRGKDPALRVSVVPRPKEGAVAVDGERPVPLRDHGGPRGDRDLREPGPRLRDRRAARGRCTQQHRQVAGLP